MHPPLAWKRNGVTLYLQLFIPTRSDIFSTFLLTICNLLCLWEATTVLFSVCHPHCTCHLRNNASFLVLLVQRWAKAEAQVVPHLHCVLGCDAEIAPRWHRRSRHLWHPPWAQGTLLFPVRVPVWGRGTGTPDIQSHFGTCASKSVWQEVKMAPRSPEHKENPRACCRPSSRK